MRRLLAGCAALCLAVSAHALAARSAEPAFESREVTLTVESVGLLPPAKAVRVGYDSHVARFAHGDSVDVYLDYPRQVWPRSFLHEFPLELVGWFPWKGEPALRVKRDGDCLWAAAGSEAEWRLATLDARAPSGLKRLLDAEAEPAPEAVIVCAADLRDAKVAARLASMKNLSLVVEGFVDPGTVEGLGNVQRLLLLHNDAVVDLKFLGKLPSLQALRLLDCPKLSSLSGVEAAAALQWLELLSVGPVSGFEALGKVPELRGVTISDSEQLESLAFVGNSQKIERVRIWRCPRLTDISALAGTAQLRELHLAGCVGVTDFSPVSKLTKLETLDLSLTSLESLACSAGMKLLKELSVDFCTGLRDVSALKGLEQLEVLSVQECPQVAEWSYLGGAKALRLLRMDGDDPVKMGGVERLSALAVLDVRGTQGPIDLKTIAKIPNLRCLDARDCRQVASVKDLGSASRMEVLLLAGCANLTDVSGLEQLSKLQVLDLAFCRDLADASPLRTLSGLKELRLDFCRKLKSIDFLAGQGGLRRLGMNRCSSLDGVAAIKGLAKLEMLEADGVTEKDWSVLGGLSQLQWLRIGGYALATPEQVALLSKLRELRCLDLYEAPPQANYAFLDGLDKLECLNISGILWGRRHDWSPLGRRQKLKYLGLSLADEVNYQEVAKLQNLRWLNAGEQSIGRAEIRLLAGTASLSWLNLKGNRKTLEYDLGLAGCVRLVEVMCYPESPLAKEMARNLPWARAGNVGRYLGESLRLKAAGEPKDRIE